MELVANADDDATFGSAVEFGEGESVDVGSSGELACLFYGVLSSAGIKDEEHFVGSVGHEFLHDLFDFAQFVHESDFVVEAASGVDDDDIGLFGDGGLEGVVGHGGGVGVHALLDDGDTYAVGPKLKLLDGGGAEGVGSTEHDAFAGLFVLVSEFGNGGCFANAVNPYNKNDVGMSRKRGIEIFGEVAAVLVEEGGDFGPEDRVEFVSADVFVALDAFLQFFDNFECCFNPYIGGDESFLEVVEDDVVDGGFAQNAFCEFGKETLFGFGESLVECLFLFFFTE